MKQLQQFGLSYYESKAIDVLLRERCLLKGLSRKASIPPGKVYAIVNSLLKRGLVVVTDERPKSVYVPDAGAVIAKLIAQKQRDDETLFNELRGMITNRTSPQHNPFFQLGTTIEENKAIQLRTFTEAEKEVCQILNIHHKPLMNRSSKTVWEKYIGIAVSRGVMFRALYPHHAVLPHSLQALPREKFCVKYIDTDFARCDIIDKKKVLLKLVHRDPIVFGGVLFIENERFARNLQNIFEQFWEEAKH